MSPKRKRGKSTLHIGKPQFPCLRCGLVCVLIGYAAKNTATRSFLVELPLVKLPLVETVKKNFRSSRRSSAT
jgi:hypothetical protein